ncbi:hypothetical protein [Nocardia heshunensis]
MGVDIYAAIGRWDRVVETLGHVGAEELWMLIWGHPSEEDGAYFEEGRFLWRHDDPVPWFGECAFRFGRSFKPHWWLGEAWEGVRDRDDVASDLVALFDVFIGRLLWRGADGEADLVGPSGLKTDGAQGLYAACSPVEVAALARHWPFCAARLEELRAPLTAQITEWTGWYDTFDQWATVLTDWGEVVQEADRRGWGLFYFVE